MSVCVWHIRWADRKENNVEPKKKIFFLNKHKGKQKTIFPTPKRNAGDGQDDEEEDEEEDEEGDNKERDNKRARVNRRRKWMEAEMSGPRAMQKGKTVVHTHIHKAVYDFEK